MSSQGDAAAAAVGPAPIYRRSDTVGIALAILGAALLALAPNSITALSALLLLVAAFSLQPVLGLSLLGLALPFYMLPKSFGSLSFSIPELMLLCTAAGAAAHGGWQRWHGTRFVAARAATPLDLPIVLFLAAALLSLLASEVMRVSLRDLRTLILEPVVAFYLAAWFLQRKTHIQWMLWCLLLGGVAAAALGLYQYFFTDHVIAAEGARRILGPYFSPNQLGLYMGRTIPLAVAFVLFTPSWRLAAAGASVLLAAALVLTFSVGAWLATLLAVAGVVLLWKARAILALVAGTAALGAASLPLLSSERIASHLSLTQGTSFIRVQLWQSSIQMIRDHPILGVGMDNFLYQYRSGYMLPEAVAEPNLSHPHNLVLNFWLQMGILGVAAIAWLLARLAGMWRELWRTELAPWERAGLAGMAGAAIDMVAHGMVDNSYFLVDLAFFFWLTAGILAALHVKLLPALHGSGRIE